MHIDRIRYNRGDKTYEQILLRESYRQPGAKRSAVKKRTLLNLTKYPPHLIWCFNVAHRQQPPWPIVNYGAVRIDCRFSQDGRSFQPIGNDEARLPKGCRLLFDAKTDIPEPFEVHWQVSIPVSKPSSRVV